MVILKKKIEVPNLTSNFETHKNVGDNFYFVYKYTLIVQIIGATNYRVPFGRSMRFEGGVLKNNQFNREFF